MRWPFAICAALAGVGSLYLAADHYWAAVAPSTLAASRGWHEGWGHVFMTGVPLCWLTAAWGLWARTRMKAGRAIRLATAACVGLILTATAVGLSPMSYSLKERLLQTLLLPLGVIIKPAYEFINFLLPGTYEPASMSLPPWWHAGVWLLAVLLFHAFVSAVVYVLSAWREQMRPARDGGQ